MKRKFSGSTEDFMKYLCESGFVETIKMFELCKLGSTIVKNMCVHLNLLENFWLQINMNFSKIQPRVSSNIYSLSLHSKYSTYA